ncbi:hypothetical protein FNJ87_04575 [Nonlabens mediterrranea]|uniref:DUF3278 domain-containing protein n=1 Tax=Nonlabens mediterrranea TaxID=1419947 RepID=A0ABS0A2N7_9FLAO|nr:hypothetical protein [Nonlabens mediterrranea]
MDNDILNKVWNEHKSSHTIPEPSSIIAKANQQRRKQNIGLIVMGITVLILIAYATLYLPSSFNSFSLGLTLMVASMLVRIIIEMYSKLQKASKLASMDAKTYKLYLKRYYKWRMKINYILTPVCFAIYCYGLYLLFPYFKNEFSNGFYIYLIVSAVISLIVIGAIIINQIIKETRFLKLLQH